MPPSNHSSCYTTPGSSPSVTGPASSQSAAGLIHTDLAKGFICAETISYLDFIQYGGEQEAKNNGCQRKEGRDYIVNDGDVMLFLFNV